MCCAVWVSFHRLLLLLEALRRKLLLRFRHLGPDSLPAITAALLCVSTISRRREKMRRELLLLLLLDTTQHMRLLIVACALLCVSTAGTCS